MLFYINLVPLIMQKDENYTIPPMYTGVRAEEVSVEKLGTVKFVEG